MGELPGLHSDCMCVTPIPHTDCIGVEVQLQQERNRKVKSLQQQRQELSPNREAHTHYNSL